MAVMITSAAQIAACLRCMLHLLIGECAAGAGSAHGLVPNPTNKGPSVSLLFDFAAQQLSEPRGRARRSSGPGLPSQCRTVAPETRSNAANSATENPHRSRSAAMGTPVAPAFDEPAGRASSSWAGSSHPWSAASRWSAPEPPVSAPVLRPSPATLDSAVPLALLAAWFASALAVGADVTALRILDFAASTGTRPGRLCTLLAPLHGRPRARQPRLLRPPDRRGPLPGRFSQRR